MKHRSGMKAVLVFALAALATLFSLGGCKQPADSETTAAAADKTALASAIAEAETAKAGVRIDTAAANVPEGAFWVTRAEMDALDAALAAAKAVNADAAATQAGVDAAKDALEAAAAVFDGAKKEGAGAGSPGLPAYDMVSVTGATVSASIGGTNGAFYAASTTAVTVPNFKIGKTEVTYELWYAVKEWAKQNGYSFGNEGKEGSAGTAGAAPAENKLHPVTDINFRDMVVWCNAYSEASGKIPVYYEDGEYAAVLKDAESNTDPAAESGKAEEAALKVDANGYRLPTKTEWEYAARGGDPSDTTNWEYDYAGSSTADEVAWYQNTADGATHAVAIKTENKLGLFDMSGNVYERVQDKSGSSRLIKGGYWNNPVSNLKPDFQATSGALGHNGNTGFRPASNF